MKNSAKHLSYTAAWDRIKSAMEAGYYLESVALCESIISDRLISHVQGVSGKKESLRTTFKQIIQDWKDVSGPVSWGKYSDLPSAVDAWRRNRNTVVHGMVKSEPGKPTQSPDSFLEMAKESAEEGRSLAKAVCAWHKKELASAKRGTKS
jgi:hypothetical protein